MKRVASMLLTLALVLGWNTAKLVAFETDWQRAGEICAAIVADIVAQRPDPGPGETWCFEGVPDSYRDRYVFRNGLGSALTLAYGRRDFVIERRDQGGTPSRAGCDCVFAFQGCEVRARCLR